jgi:hypothetical protein
MFVATVLHCGRPFGKSFCGVETGRTSVVVSAGYFWNSLTLIGVHRVHLHPKWAGPRWNVTCSRHVTERRKCDSLRFGVFGEETVTAAFLNSVLQNLAEVMQPLCEAWPKLLGNEGDPLRYT